jgi:hypothetical protein
MKTPTDCLLIRIENILKNSNLSQKEKEYLNKTKIDLNNKNYSPEQFSDILLQIHKLENKK